MVKVEITHYKVVGEGCFPRTVEVKETVELSKWELAVAIVADSIGYATPEHALIHVRDFVNGKKEAYCECGVALFGRDLKALRELAACCWFRCSEKEKNRLKAFAEKWRELEQRNPIAGWAVSSLYPTLNLGE